MEKKTKTKRAILAEVTSQDTDTKAKTKVAILGGGPGSLAAAFELTKKEYRDRYEVTVYQQGWRLGGKCASGRQQDDNSRILEHGLHMLLGFYEEAFGLLRECYEERQELPGESPFPTFLDALEKQNQVTLQERVGKETTEWTSWNVTFAVRDGAPGDPQPPTLMRLLVSFVEWLTRKHKRVKVERLRRASLRRAEWLLKRTELALETSLKWHPTEKILRLARDLHADHRQVNAGLFIKIIVLVESLIEELSYLEQETEEALRHDLLLLRLGYSGLKGLVRDVLLHDGDFSRIDNLDFRVWLMRHGARDCDVWSAPVKALYDLGFAYVDGEATDPASAQAAAGVALYVSLQIMFGCRGALLWKMKGGAGDILFAPLYEVLQARGVRFKFFHRVDRLRLSSDRSNVNSIEITRQAFIKGDKEYEPLVDVAYGQSRLRCWPSEAKWDQLLHGASIKARLQMEQLSLESADCRVSEEEIVLTHGGTDEYGFDLVVLGIPVGALKNICGDLIEARSAWKSMVNGISTVQTQSVQLWMRPDLKGLGWSWGSTVSISYVEPFDAWGEMSHLLPAEPWKGERPGSIEYFCSAMPTQPGTWASAQAVAKANAYAFLNSAIGHLWPNAVDGNGRIDPRLVLRQYARANVDPSERYVLSVPNSIALRLPPDCSTFANLYLAGDWVAGRINSGSVEAAMSAGIHAARAIHAIQAPSQRKPPEALAIAG
jgi:uncharacterized protein with NAD-binding domain and iron-sulfur cluster